MIRAALLGVALLAPSAVRAQDAVMGAWQRDDGIAQVKVAPCGKVICMTNTYIKPGPPDERVGERIEFDLTAAGGSSLSGTVRDPKTGKSYATTVEVAGETMTTRGCILGGVICKTTNWTRIR